MGKSSTYWVVFNAWWYDENSQKVWSSESKGPPSLSECKAHAKCLRSVDEVRSYFQRYRASKKPGAKAPAEGEAQEGKAQEGKVQEGKAKEEGDAPPLPGPSVGPSRDKGRRLPVESKVKMSKMKIWSTAQGPPPPGHEQAAAKRKLEEQETLMSRKVKRRGEGASDDPLAFPMGELEAFEPDVLLGAIQQILMNFNQEANLETQATMGLGLDGQALCQPEHPCDSAPSNIVSSAAPTQLMPSFGGFEEGYIYPSDHQRPYNQGNQAPSSLPFPFPLCSPVVGGKVEGLESLFASPLPPPPLTYPTGACPHFPQALPLTSSLPPSALKQKLLHNEPPLGWSPANDPLLPNFPILTSSQPFPIATHPNLSPHFPIPTTSRPPLSSAASATRGANVYPLPFPSTSHSTIIPCPPGSCTKKYLSSHMTTSLGLAAMPPPPSPLAFDHGLLDEELMRMLEGTPTRHQIMAPPPSTSTFALLPSSASHQRTPAPPLFLSSSLPLAAMDASKVTTPLDRQALASLFGTSPL